MSDRHRRPPSGRPSAGSSGRAGKPSTRPPDGPVPAPGSGGQPRSGSGDQPRTGPGGEPRTHAGDPRGGQGGTSRGPGGTPRAGRREAERKRPAQPATPTLIDQLRKPFIVSFVVFVITAGALIVWTQTAQPAYACGRVDTVQPAASGELGQVQADQGNQHVQPGEHVTYPVCPPASGNHINQQGYGPLQPKVYGPDEQSLPNGWVHNLEHGGLVLLYSCDKGPCDSTAIAALQTFSAQFPASPICQLPAGYVSPVVARFEQMPTRFAALLWDRALYLDTLDTQKIDAFFTRYSERRTADGTWVSPPEPQCTPPSASPAASASPAPSASGG